MSRPSNAARSAFAALALLFLLGASLGAQSAPPCTIDASSCTNVSPTCTADSSWFNNGQIAVTSLPVDLTSSDPSTQTNCMFHQLAWQDFLYLVSPSGTAGLLNFETWMLWNGVFVASGAPLPWGQQPSVPSECGTGASRAMVLTAQTNDFISDVIDEAGSLKPLIDQSGNYVHYEMRVNEIFYDFIVNCQLYQRTCFNKADSLTLPNGDPSTGAVGTFELKSAWKTLVEGVDDFSRYYTVQAAVQPVSPTNSACETVTVGLVGMHIVQKTPSHPEMVWATFEQIDNAPNCDNQSQAPPNGSSWSLFPAGSTCDTTQGCTSNCCNTYIAGQATPNCRENTCGGGSESEDENQCDIQTLNDSVHSALSSTSVWQYYYLTGALWEDQSQPSTPQAGSVDLANVTAETYTQGTNCFGCHTSTFSSFDKKHEGEDFVELDFSHIFGRIQELGSCTSLPSTCTSTGASEEMKAEPAKSEKSGYGKQGSR